MSGLGSRFLRAGYEIPKPLIEVDGRSMISWVLRMFPGQEDPLFICREEHIAETNMQSMLSSLKPNGRIAVIQGAKLGPVAALMAAENEIDDERPILISYCDYYMHWDFAAFCEQMVAGQYAGAVPCYTGFHPHLLPQKNLYACCRIDANEELLEIREKHSFEIDKTMANHSPGVYYFDSGRTFKKYARMLLEKDDDLNGEYYVSMIYNHMVKDGLRVAVPLNVRHFCQWGTPEDLSEYLYWTCIARKRAE